MPKQSKYMSYVLRHNPSDGGVVLDSGGWTGLADLVNGSKGLLTTEAVLEVVKTDEKGRYQVSDDGTRIRCVQGHSTAVDMDYQPSAPPELLYHGTATRFVASIRESGLVPRTRQYVHLSADVATAETVGKRHGEVVVLVIDSGSMHADGIEFYQADNGVWLTKAVKPQYIQ